MISVAALKENEQVADFSQHPTSSYNPDAPPPNVHWDVVELSAGGQEVLSTWPYRVEHEVTVGGTTYHGNHIEEASSGSHTAELVDGGRCTSTDGGWSGKLVLCERGDVTFATKINNVGTSGGLAAIIYNHEPGNFFGTCAGDCTTGTPAISLSQEDGQELVATALGAIGVFVSLEEAATEGGYYTISGTSMATPAVAAGVGWAWSACGGPTGITNKQLRQLLRDSAKDLVGTREAGGTYGPGWDRYIVRVGETLTFTVVVENLGPDDAPGASVVDQVPVELDSVTWSCTPSGDAHCTASGDLDVDDQVDIPVGDSVTYVVEGTVADAGDFSFDNTAQVSPPSGFVDPVEANDASTVSVVVCGGNDEVLLDPGTVTTSKLEMASGTLTAGDGYRILSGGDVTFRVCGRVILKDGFSVEGGRLAIEVESP